jgi:hypothetical protein
MVALDSAGQAYTLSGLVQPSGGRAVDDLSANFTALLRERRDASKGH